MAYGPYGYQPPGYPGRPGRRLGNPNVAPIAQTQNPRPIPGTGGQQSEDFFTYVVAIASIAAGATVNNQITIQADSNFEWVMATTEANLAGAADGANLEYIDIPIAVQITDGGSGRQLMNGAVPLGSIAGTGKQPFILPVPRMFMAKSTVTFIFTSFSANAWNNIYFNLIGRKIFMLGNQPIGS